MSESMVIEFVRGSRVAADETTCVECGRRFDLYNEDDASEWFYGHDCEAS